MDAKAKVVIPPIRYRCTVESALTIDSEGFWVQHRQHQVAMDAARDALRESEDRIASLLTGLEALAGEMNNALGHDEHGSYISEQTIVEWAETLSTLASAGLEGKGNG